MPVHQPKGAKGRCDDLFSLIIRSRGVCERCGETCACPDAPGRHTRACKLTTSHIVSRRYSATRTDVLNAQCLCYSCHRHFTDWPREFSHWITDSIGSELYDRLKSKAELVTKVDWNEELIRLKAIATELGIR
jgi:5-methylcytosine-specific restriction endonuclease McrA